MAACSPMAVVGSCQTCDWPLLLHTERILTAILQDRDRKGDVRSSYRDPHPRGNSRTCTVDRVEMTTRIKQGKASLRLHHSRQNSPHCGRCPSAAPRRLNALRRQVSRDLAQAFSLPLQAGNGWHHAGCECVCIGTPASRACVAVELGSLSLCSSVLQNMPTRLSVPAKVRDLGSSTLT
jgi:hypothetical protein